MNLLYKVNVTQVCQKPENFIKFLKKTLSRNKRVKDDSMNYCGVKDKNVTRRHAYRTAPCRDVLRRKGKGCRLYAVRRSRTMAESQPRSGTQKFPWRNSDFIIAVSHTKFKGVLKQFLFCGYKYLKNLLTSENS
jgi:hypothetical protein